MMTHLQFNLNLTEIKEDLLNSNLNDVVKSSIVLILNDYMERERDDYINVGSHERSHARQDYRNGYYTRELLLKVGRITLRVPRTRSGDFHTEVFERYQRSEKSFLLAIMDMFYKGVSTRGVTKVIRTLNDAKISKSMVSELTKQIQTEVEEWNQRSLEDIDYCPYIFLDATYIKVRENNRVISKAIYIAQSLDDKGKRSILGFRIDAGESYDVWRDFISSLIKRGLKSPRLVISDAHKGLRKAIDREFNGTSWQRCLVHFKRNLVVRMPKKGYSEVRYELLRIFDEVDAPSCRIAKNNFIKKYEDDQKLHNLIDTLEDGFEDAIQHMVEPIKRHNYIRSTNSLERVNQNIKNRSNSIRIFPNDASAFRVAGSILMEYEERQEMIRALY